MMKPYLMLAAVLLVAGCASTKTDTVQIDASGRTKLKGKPIALSEISEHLRRETVLIRAHRATRHKNVIAVMDEVREAGIESVSLATDEDR